MSISTAFGFVQGTVWVVQNVYYAGYYLLYGKEESDTEAIQRKLDELQAEMKEIKERESRKEKLFEIERLRRIQRIRAEQEARGDTRSTDPMAQSCPNVLMMSRDKQGEF